MKFVGDNCAFLTIVSCSGDCVVRMLCVRVSVRACASAGPKVSPTVGP